MIEHRFTAKDPTGVHTIEPACQFAFTIPDFDAVDNSLTIQSGINILKFRSDPRSPLPWSKSFRACADHAREILIDRERMLTLTPQLTQAAGSMNLIKIEH